MQIPFKIVDTRYIAEAEVEIPEQVLNHFPSYITDNVGYLDIPHIRKDSFSRIMGDAALRFTEEPNKLPIPDNQYKGIHIDFPIIDTKDVNAVLSILKKQGLYFYNTKKDFISKLGFQQRNIFFLWHPALGDDINENWISFDIETDDISYLIFKVFNIGWTKSGEKVRKVVKDVLNKV
jgi:hypothetical protein